MPAHHTSSTELITPHAHEAERLRGLLSLNQTKTHTSQALHIGALSGDDGCVVRSLPHSGDKAKWGTAC